MRAIVGLGNPGSRYKSTRHNVGWHVVDRLAARWGAGKASKARHAEVAKAALDGESILLLKPLTYMNDSGKAVRALVEKDLLPLEHVLVVYDDLDLAFGKLRLRAGGSSGGHNGIKSIQLHVAGKPGDFPRIKVGIGRPPAGVDPVDHVLTTFAPVEKPIIEEAIERAADAVECWVQEGIEAAMNKFNGK
ncbi:MAG TPA: aminoacyl-tRNA hydrolase [Chloroflexota bacterium]|nr:aminoacyl-tRNA hydrolase [Chloroflexota bacterium]